MIANRSRERWIDGLRGLAALGVAWFHLYIQGGGDQLIGRMPSILTHASLIGRHGVELFFVISGLVLGLTLIPRSDVRSAKDVGRYLVRRSLRLDPPYLVALALYLTCFSAFFEAYGSFVDPAQSFERLFSSVFYFLPRRTQLYVPVAWTLGLEVQFYALAAAWLVAVNRLGRRFNRQTVVAAGLRSLLILAALPVFGIGVNSSDSAAWILSHLSTFMIGMTAAGILLDVPGGTVLFCFAMAISGVRAYQGEVRQFAALCSGLLITVLLLSAIVRRAAEIRVLQFLGGASYSLYLMHHLVGGIVIAQLRRLSSAPGVTQLSFVIAGVLAAIFFAELMRIAVERPSIAWSKRISFGGSKQGYRIETSEGVLAAEAPAHSGS